jgi:hypothetical protein
MIPKAGAELDHLVSESLGGGPQEAPPYSSDDAAAEAVLETLAGRGIFCSVESSGGIWCVKLSATFVRVETLGSGSSRSRALAICRAVANVVSWPSNGVEAPPVAAPETEKTSEPAEDTTRATCEICHRSIRRKTRRATRVLCPICSWRLGETAEREYRAMRKARRRALKDPGKKK